MSTDTKSIVFVSIYIWTISSIIFFSFENSYFANSNAICPDTYITSHSLNYFQPIINLC